MKGKPINADFTTIDGFWSDEEEKKEDVTTLCCHSSHALMRLDGRGRHDFLDKPTKIFPPLCGRCFLNKFSLFEDETRTFNNVHYYLNIRKKTCFSDRKEGPFLRCFKVGVNIYQGSFVFCKNTVILPVGCILFDAFMSDQYNLFANTFHSITYTKNNAKYVLNPYLFNYFKTIYEKKVNPSDPGSVIQLMINETIFNIAYQTDAYLFGNLIPPKAHFLSPYIKYGERIILLENNAVNINVTKIPDEDDVDILITNPTTPYTTEDIKYMNEHVLKNASFVDEVSKKRKNELSNKYFVKNKSCNNLPTSASGLYLAYFCIPSTIVDDNDWNKCIRYLRPNVKFEEGIGLISVDNIFEGDFLVIEACIPISSYVDSKASFLKQIYSKPTRCKKRK